MSLKQLLPAAALAALIATPAAAQDIQALQKACMSDIKALCAGIQPGGGRIRDCMLQKREQASPGCQAAISAAIQANASGAAKN